MNSPRSRWPKFSEDWLSVVVGLLIVLIVALGALGRAPWPLFGWFK